MDASAPGSAGPKARAGINVAIPKLRQGPYFPDWLLEPRKRAEKALNSVAATCYLLGVSTRRIDKLVQSLGISGLSKSQVSVMAKDLDEQVTAFRHRRLDQGPYTFVAADGVMVFTHARRTTSWIARSKQSSSRARRCATALRASTYWRPCSICPTVSSRPVTRSPASTTHPSPSSGRSRLLPRWSRARERSPPIFSGPPPRSSKATRRSKATGRCSPPPSSPATPMCGGDCASPPRAGGSERPGGRPPRALYAAVRRPPQASRPLTVTVEQVVQQQIVNTAESYCSADVEAPGEVV